MDNCDTVVRVSVPHQGVEVEGTALTPSPSPDRSLNADLLRRFRRGERARRE